MSTLLEKGMPTLKALREVNPDSDCLLFLAQSALESGRFGGIIGQHNVWGIKWFKGWTGLSVETVTHEKFKNKDRAERFHLRRVEYSDPPVWDEPAQRWKVRVVGRFRDWATRALAARWYLGLLKRRYPIAFYARCPSCFVYGLQHGDGGRKYFTDNPAPYEWAIGKLHERLQAEELLLSSNPGGECTDG